MKKKISLGFVFAMALVLLTAAALATTLLLSPRADAVRTADQALEEKYGITAEMQTFFERKQETLQDGTVRVIYSGFAETEYVLGVYTATMKDGKAEVLWSREGEDVSGGYEASAWGIDQLRQMVADSKDEARKQAYLDKAAAIGEAHGTRMDNSSSEPIEDWFTVIEARKTAALNARKVSEDEMIAAGREFIISNWGLNEEQIARMELFTNYVAEVENEDGETEAIEQNGNGWYDMINDRPCFKVEYLLGDPEVPEEELEGEVAVRQYKDKDGYYVVYVNVETGEIEDYEYNSGLAGIG